MRRRNKLPERWLFTDERQGERLWDALQKLPRGSGVVFRHYDAPNRAELLRRVAEIAKRRRLFLVVAAPGGLPRPLVVRGQHMNRSRNLHRPVTASAHNFADLVRAERLDAQLAFLSPVFRTKSHTGARPLSAVRFGLMTRRARIPVAALGGITSARYRQLKPLGAVAWGAITALS